MQHKDFYHSLLKRSPYNVNYTMRVSQNDNKTTINHQHLKSTEKYLIGKYNVEIFTLPRIYMEVEVKEKQTTTIDVPAAGTIDLTCKTPMVGQIFVLNEGNNYDWVCNLNSKSNKQKWNLQRVVNTNLFTEEQNNFLPHIQLKKYLQ